MRRKNDFCITTRLITALVASMVTFTVVAQAPSPRPRLVVGIMIDGLREDYLDLLKGYFGEDGFKRIMRDGVMFEDVNYGTAVDVAAATAMIYTGSSPAINGIPAAMVYDTEKRISYPIVLDPTKIGNYTDETYSPKAIKVSTLSDEVRIDGGGLGNVYSVATSAPQSIILAGHAGNQCILD